jgi:hypothetical protein
VDDPDIGALRTVSLKVQHTLSAASIMSAAAPSLNEISHTRAPLQVATQGLISVAAVRACVMARSGSREQRRELPVLAAKLT